MDHQLNVMRREAERAMSRTATVRMGIVSGYDPNNYAAKVRLQPEDVETGWLPIATPWSGNGWGDYCPPTPGDVVDVHFQEGGKEAGFVSGRHFGDRFRPLPVPSGERWMVHQSGSCLKFRNDGSVELKAAGALNVSATAVNGDGLFNAQNYYARGTPPIPDGTYRTGLGLSQDGYITILGGIIVAIQEAN